MFFQKSAFCCVFTLLLLTGCDNDTCQDCYDDLDACEAKASTTGQYARCIDEFSECYNRAKKYDVNCK